MATACGPFDAAQNQKWYQHEEHHGVESICGTIKLNTMRQLNLPLQSAPVLSSPGVTRSARSRVPRPTPALPPIVNKPAAPITSCSLSDMITCQ